MTFTILYAPAALEDMDQVWEEVLEASEDLDTADRYIEGLQNAVMQKKAFPQSGKRLMYDGAFTGIYYVTYKAYHVFYRIRGNALEVSRILYGASDYLRVLFGKSEFVPEDIDD